VLVNPTGGGNVSVNGTTPGAYPAVMQFVDGTPLNVIATQNGGYTFVNWTILHHTLTPNNTSQNANFNITSDDTLIANFTLLPTIDTFNIVVQAYPPNAGSVTVNSTVFTTYPGLMQVLDNTVLNCSAAANANFQFLYWHLVYHTTTPNDTANPMNFTVHQTDTIYAIFQQLPPLPPDSFDIVVDVCAEGRRNVFAGDVAVNNFTPPGYPWTFRFEGGANVTFDATGNTSTTSGNRIYNYTFEHYSAKNHFIYPDTISSSVFIQVHQSDTVVCFFVEKIPLDTVTNVCIPSGFTPDANGVNDEFKVFLKPDGRVFSDFNLQIFNRWGQKVFESNNQGHGWNGEFNGKPCPLGVYSYSLVAKDDAAKEIIKKGTITLLR